MVRQFSTGPVWKGDEPFADPEFSGFAQIFGGLVAYGIAKGVAKDGASLAGWQIIFLTIGLLTMSYV